MTRRWFDGTILVVSLFLVAMGALVKPWARKTLAQGNDGVVNKVAETAAVIS